MDYFPRKSLSKYLIIADMIRARNLNDKWGKYAGGGIGQLFKIT